MSGTGYNHNKNLRNVAQGDTEQSGLAADCAKKSADVAQSVSKSSRKTSRPSRRERIRRVMRRAALAEIVCFDGRELASFSLTTSDVLFISQECGVIAVEESIGMAYQIKTKRPPTLSHEGLAATLLAEAEAEHKRRAEERNRELGYGKYKPKNGRCANE